MTLQLPWKRFWYRFDGDFEISSKPVYLSTPCDRRRAEEQVHADTGNEIWDAAVFLARFLESRPDLCRGKRVLELGSGCTGLAGIAASLLGAHLTTFSDLSYCLQSLRENVNRNCSASHRVVEIDWEKPAHAIGPVDLILASDVVWLEGLVECFVNCVACLSQLYGNCQIVVSHQSRSASVDAEFFRAMREAGFSRETLCSEDNLSIYSFTR